MAARPADHSRGDRAAERLARSSEAAGVYRRAHALWLRGGSIDVLLGTSAASGIRIERAFMVANMSRGDAGSAAIVARPTNLDAPVHEALARQIAEAVAELREYGWDGRSTARLVIFGGDGEGYLREVEVAVDADSDGRCRVV
jgi:hypothetical protein